MADLIERIKNANTIKELVDSVKGEAALLSKDKHDWYECMFGDMAELFNAFADRLSVLDKQRSNTLGNAAAMREALVEIRDAINKWYDDEYISHGAFSVLWDLCSDALSAPARQCDVGTANEQDIRFEDFCFAHKSREHGCSDCPAMRFNSCELGWAQTPYAEEGAGE